MGDFQIIDPPNQELKARYIKELILRGLLKIVVLEKNAGGKIIGTQEVYTTQLSTTIQLVMIPRPVDDKIISFTQ